jgi:hypothetical protein
MQVGESNNAYLSNYSGDNLLQQSIALLRVRDPWFKRTGASRLARYAVDGMQVFTKNNFKLVHASIKSHQFYKSLL